MASKLVLEKPVIFKTMQEANKYIDNYTHLKEHYAYYIFDIKKHEYKVYNYYYNKLISIKGRLG